MKSIKRLLLAVFSLCFMGSATINCTFSPWDDGKNSIDDLEYYITQISCIPKYFLCKSTGPATNSGGCLKASGCSHLELLSFLTSIDYVQKILNLDSNTDLKKSTNKALRQYGRANLEAQIKGYSDTNIQTLISDLVKALKGNQVILENNGTTMYSPTKTVSDYLNS